jgi:hypothetical protein
MPEHVAMGICAQKVGMPENGLLRCAGGDKNLRQISFMRVPGRLA